MNLFSFFKSLFSFQPKTEYSQQPLIVAAKVLEVRKHPNADRLRVIKCDIGNKIIDPIVCGAFNFEAGAMVVLALPGATIAQNIHSDKHEPFTLGKAKIRGIESEGMVCELAFNGQEAVDMARKGHCHIILMDIRMPVMDGYQATREIREFDVETPIVALSANVFSDEIQNAFESGMDDFLEKPIVVPKLLVTLRQFLSTPA